MIGLYNTDSKLRSKLEKVFDIAGLDKLDVEPGDFPKLQGLFIDWKTSVNEYEFAQQAVIIENYLKKGIPTVIFDRHMAIKYKEYSWLRKFNVTFLEPAIGNRSGFEFQPFWTDKKEIEKYGSSQRGIHVGYSGNLDKKILPFEKYYIEYKRLYPQKEVVILTQPASLQHKIDEWSEYNVKFSDKFEWTNVDFTILIGTKKEFRTGQLPKNIFEILESGCIPILPLEHRFYGTVFKDFLIKSIVDAQYYIDTYWKYRNVMVEEIRDRFLSVYPECDIKNVVKRLKKCMTI